MNAAVLLCLAALSADSSTAVRAKVLYGTSPDQQQRADIELWISQAVAEAGSPLALPYTGWIDLTGDEQRLYTSKQGGFIIDGKASDRNGKYGVEINGCEGFLLQAKVTLRPGERRVVSLTDNPAPNNVFVALVAPKSEMATTRAKQLKASIKTFRLQLDYNGDEDKPFYRLRSVVGRSRGDASHLHTALTCPSPVVASAKGCRTPSVSFRTARRL